MSKQFDKDFSQKIASALFTFLGINCQLPQLKAIALIFLLSVSFSQLTTQTIYSQHRPNYSIAIQMDETNAPPQTIKKALPPRRTSQKKRIQVEWFGRSFIYLTTSTGVRIAINPFPSSTPGYQFPHGLAADVILISDSNQSHDGAEMISGTPMIFRGPVAVGANRASGIVFHGIATRQQQSSNTLTDHNTVFHFTLDGMKFVHVGSLGHALTTDQISAIGRADILFLPVGNRKLSLKDIDKIIYDLDPAIVIPIEYQLRPQDRSTNLRPLAPFIQHEKNIVSIEQRGFLIATDLLPEKTTIVTLTPPPLNDPLKP